MKDQQEIDLNIKINEQLIKEEQLRRIYNDWRRSKKMEAMDFNEDFITKKIMGAQTLIPKI